MSDQTQASISEEAFNRLSKKLEVLPQGVMTATALVMVDVVRGRPWAFVTKDVPLFLEENEATISAGGIFKLIKVNPSCVLIQVADQVKFTNLMKELIKEVKDPNFYSEQDIIKAQQLEVDAVEKLTKYLKYTFEKKGRRQTIIGIYNLNDSDSITINGVTYPSFGVTVETLKHVLYSTGLPLRILNVNLAEVLGLQKTAQVGNYILAPSGNALLLGIGV